MDQITPGMTYGLTALTVAIWSIPLLFVIWRLTGLYQDSGLVFLGKFGLMFLIPYIGDLVPSNAIMGLIYILAGAAK